MAILVIAPITRLFECLTRLLKPAENVNQGRINKTAWPNVLGYGPKTGAWSSQPCDCLNSSRLQKSSAKRIDSRFRRRFATKEVHVTCHNQQKKWDLRKACENVSQQTIIIIIPGCYCKILFNLRFLNKLTKYNQPARIHIDGINKYYVWSLYNVGKTITNHPKIIMNGWFIIVSPTLYFNYIVIYKYIYIYII